MWTRKNPNQSMSSGFLYSLPSLPASWYFYFHDEKKIKKIAVTPRMAGYNEFVDMLKKKGFPSKAQVLLILIK